MTVEEIDEGPVEHDWLVALQHFRDINIGQYANPPAKRRDHAYRVENGEKIIACGLGVTYDYKDWPWWRRSIEHECPQCAAFVVAEAEAAAGAENRRSASDT